MLAKENIKFDYLKKRLLIPKLLFLLKPPNARVRTFNGHIKIGLYLSKGAPGWLTYCFSSQFGNRPFALFTKGQSWYRSHRTMFSSHASVRTSAHTNQNPRIGCATKIYRLPLINIFRWCTRTLTPPCFSHLRNERSPHINYSRIFRLAY